MAELKKNFYKGRLQKKVEDNVEILVAKSIFSEKKNHLFEAALKGEKCIKEHSERLMLKAIPKIK